jgi:radical SAM superfamily enzyme YgiQ (UPF0313 family)
MRILLVGMYDTNTVSLAPQIFHALAREHASSLGHEIETREFSIFSDDAASVAARIAEWGPDVVCFSCYIWNVRLVTEVAARLSCTVVVGGPQVAGIEAELLRDNPGIDVVATGEGEATFAALLEAWADRRPLAEVPGITTRELTTRPAPPTDLTTVPPVWADVFARYPDITWVSFETSRGCPMACGYCTWGSSRRMRYFPLDYVLAELDLVLRSPRIAEIYLCDSSLLHNRTRALAILDHIIASGSRQTIRYEFAPEQLDDEVIERMRRLPSNEFNFGIQTVSPPALAAIGRRFHRERFEARYRAFVEALPEARVTVDLIYGLPDDDLQGYLRSMDYAMELPAVSRILTNPLIVLPGSRFYRDRDAYGIVLANDGSYLLESNATFSREEMREARRYSFYVNLLYLNTALRDAVLAMARDTEQRPTQVMAGLFAALPFPLVEGEYPLTIPSVKEDFERRNRAYARTLSRFGEIIHAFRAFSDHRYDALLVDAERAYTEQYGKYRAYAATTVE